MNNMSPFEKFQRFLITVLIAVGFFYGGYYFGKSGYIFEVRKKSSENRNKKSVSGEQRDRLWAFLGGLGNCE
ncbi:MAG: hypothetical protein KatS3mg101_0478 [Patescibacteria group bacterium]|nr:MAG: hypothetical protein KatS3mg101_0478 [Patescibacteria group bacterium]